jgi:DNA polymerase-3 subunit delta
MGPGDAQVSASEVEELTAASAERRAWTLADALVAGESAAAVRIYLTLRAQGERVPGLLYWMSQRLRMALEVARAVEAGEAVAQIKRGLRMPSRAADQLIADARNRGSERLREAIEAVADLELASRGGGSGGAGEDTEAVRTIVRVAG